MKNVSFGAAFPSVVAACARHSFDVVEMVDLAPTLLDLAGVSPPSDMDGRTLRNTMGGTEDHDRTAAFSEIYHGPTDKEWLRGEAPGTIPRMIRTHEWQMAVNYPEDPLYGPDGALYNRIEDPAENENLYYDRKYRDVVQRLGEQLANWA